MYFETALSAADMAGRLLLDNFYSEREISYKGRINLVTEMDTRSEELIVDELKKKYPGHDILAEEGSYKDKSSDYQWIIDPLDGTTNYAHEFGFFCVSVALRKRDEGIILGVVNAPYLRECYTAVKGGGAYLNGRKIRVSSIDDVEKSMVATGFPYDVKDSHTNFEYFKRFVLRAQAVRRPGSAALDLCAVAAGKFDGFWEMKLYPWDTAAGCLIVEEAGGRVTDFEGGPFDPFKKEVIATNGLIHDKMLEVLKNA
ncbi:MAG: inositol monophosphatase [Elusimicrobia bacterium]|nr:inositol monophosphatase [Elusimicrobiota bacterium]